MNRSKAPHFLRPLLSFPWRTAMVLIVIACLSIQATVITMPEIPLLPNHLNVDHRYGQYLVGGYLLTMSISSYIFGILIQRFGWYRCVYSGITMIVVAVNGEPWALTHHSIAWFSGLNKAAAVGAGVCLPAMYTYISERLDAEQQRIFYCLMSLSLVTIPILVELTASWLITYRSFTHATGIVTFSVLLLLTNLHALPRLKHPCSSWRGCITRVWQTTQCHQLFLCGLIIGVLFGASWVFGNLMSVAVMQEFNGSPFDFGRFNFICGMAFLTTTIVQMIIGKRLSAKQIVAQSITMLVLVTGYQWWSAWTNLTSPSLWVYGMLGCGLHAATAWLVPCISQLALQPSNSKAIASGTLSSLYGLIEAFVVLTMHHWSYDTATLFRLSNSLALACVILLSLCLVRLKVLSDRSA